MFAQESAIAAGRRITLLRLAGAAPDHPLDLNCPEGAYLTNVPACGCIVIRIPRVAELGSSLSSCAADRCPQPFSFGLPSLSLLLQMNIGEKYILHLDHLSGKSSQRGSTSVKTIFMMLSTAPWLPIGLAGFASSLPILAWPPRF